MQPAKKVLKKTTTTTTTKVTTKVTKGAKGAKVSSKGKKDPLFVSTPKNLRLGGDVQVY